ncbi:MAG TPA: ABC transporter permease [Verrucomicrobiae bacterium]|nr:ABC transporter permease [Verrucomicrobiae bacterium]
MRFLSVAERELRAAARRNRTYLVRWITAIAFFGLLIWLFWAANGFQNRNAAPRVFEVLSVLTFFYCLFIGSTVTADCISAERREGTLGLLFLTNLNSFEIILGKLCSSSVVTIFGLFSMFPMLALLFMFGGIALDQFWQTVLALVNAIFFGVAAGFVASVHCRRQFTAIALAAGSGIVLGAGVLGLAGIMDSLKYPRVWVDAVSSLSPLYGLIAAGGNRVFGRNHFWLSLGVVAGLSLLGLLLASWRLSRTWQDRPKRSRGAIGLLAERWRLSGATGRARLRRRLLDWNPFFWLASRNRVSAPIFMLLTVLLVAVTVYVAAPFFDRVFRAKPGSLEGFTFSWLWLGLGLHALVLYYAAMIASQRVAEDKQSGVFELILSTPVTEKLISRGFWLAYWRRLFFPALAATAVHLFFIWLGANFAKAEADEIPKAMSVGELLWRALWKLPISGARDDWSFWYALRFVLLALVLMGLVWITLGWIARWLGLWMKHPGFAPLAALAVVCIPPVAVFTVFCVVAEETRFFRLPDRMIVPVVMWTAFGVGALHCLAVSRWAAVRLRRDFRTTIIGQISLPRSRFWWIPSRRTVVRSVAWATAVVVIAALLVTGFYGYQNYQSRRNWSKFQRTLAQKGESLGLTPLMPTPVPDELNLAKVAAFERFSSVSAATKRIFDKLQHWESISANYGNVATYEWAAQRYAPLAEYLWLAHERVPAGLSTNRFDVAPVIVDGLKPQQEFLQSIAVAARLPHFQISTNRNAMAVLQWDQTAISTLLRLHFLFCVRASALLTVDRSQDAAEDVLTSLRLAQLARQLPDAKSAARTQEMLVRSLQPLWEGLAEQRWNEPQIAAFQAELLKFDPLADFTNTVRRIVLAHIDIWRAYPAAKVQLNSVPIAGNSYIQVDGAMFRPRGWWFDDCIRLYQAGEQAIGRIDLEKEIIRRNHDWDEVRGLEIGYEIEQFISQYQWWWPTTPALLAFTQNALNQAVIACALERYCIATGSFPDTLDQLVPTYLNRIPADIVQGRPMIYERTEAGRYIVRSVGPNEQDDRKAKSSDDWLWWYGTNAPVRLNPTKN